LNRSRTPLLAIFALFLLSGATSLMYQVLWLRQLILIFGSTQFATSAILSTFMGGLALGAIVAGRWLSRSTTRPLKLYGILEFGIGVYALLVPLLFRGLSPVYRVIWDAGGSESFLLLSLAKFAGIAVVLLPPTMMMGATLPLLAREVADDPQRIGGKVGSLYAINTFGAVVGTFVAGFVAIPGIGVQATMLSTALTNGLLGLTAIIVASRGRAPSIVEETVATQKVRPPRKVRWALIAFGVSGFGALVLEVAWTRILALVMGSSVYAFSLMLLAFLIGLATGGAWFSRYLKKRPDADAAVLFASLLASAGLLAYATTWLFQLLPRLFGEIYYAWAPSANTVFGIQFAFGLLIMFPATFALGGIFPAVLQIHARRLSQVAGSVGTVYASNTLGTILGAGVAGFLLIPRLGVQPSVLWIAGLELVLAVIVALFVIEGPGARRIVPVGLAVVGLGLVLFAAPTWDVRMMNSGVYMNLFGTDEEEGWQGFESYVYENNEIIYAREGLTASVIVAEQPAFANLYLAVNGKIDASSQGDLETQLMSSHLPLLFHEDPRDILVIGLASGITVGAAAAHPVDNIRVVEVEAAMVPAARLFEKHNNYVLDDPRVTLSINDARNELEFSSADYDVIISEPSNPWMTVASNLFTADFFRMAKERVRPGGVFCQWIQNYYLPAEDMRSVVAAFRESFPYVMLFETFDGIDQLLLGSQEPLEFNLQELQARMEELKVRMDLGRIDAGRAEDILSLLRLGPTQVDRMTEGAPRNTDDNARVEFSAPKTLGLYTLDDNMAMIRRFMDDPLDLLNPPIEEPLERDRIRLTLVEKWLLRDHRDLARVGAEALSSGPQQERALEILAELERRDRDDDAQ